MFYVYLTASQKHGTLYLGVTDNLVRRIHEHKAKAVPGFTKQYSVVRLVWFEIYDDSTNAITREKEIKKWRRDWKIRLIEQENPDWFDLYDSIIKQAAAYGFRVRASGAPRNDWIMADATTPP